MWDGCSSDRWSVFVATRDLPSAGCEAPVLGLGSNRGEFDEDTAMRMRCPLLKISDVLHRSTGTSYTWPACKGSRFSKLLRSEARRMPSVTSIDRPSG